MKDIVIKNFTYNGITGRELKGFAKYTADFVKWSRDPGVAECRCSDGRSRLIPSFAFVDVDHSTLPKQTYENGKILIGESSQS